MARREVTRYYDDLDNTELSAGEVQVVDFSANGVDYTLDLSQENKQKFEEALKPFIAVARRKVRSGAAGRRTATRSANPQRNKMIREWAQANGVEVSERGRIAQSVIDKFERAQS
ncbi:MAG TPA: Lsr2 family protein [Candidatus Corynebacterium gallistercoris]|uniref:Lsr2 family protein n=1 Tax=Candidatus Corynebacterium gallistercoris TaxID=2838530 RepID=A0A9D1UQC5_9CORY|nr:Lsr2 family protein [Candidatus Corynebacterium gallistercoris]